MLCTLHYAHRAVYTEVHDVLCTVHYSAQCALNTTVHKVHRTLQYTRDDLQGSSSCETPGAVGRLGRGRDGRRRRDSRLQCAVCSVQCAVCSVQCAVYSVQCTVCSVQCTVCSVQCAVCSVQCTVCSLLTRTESPPARHVTAALRLLLPLWHTNSLARASLHQEYGPQWEMLS